MSDNVIAIHSTRAPDSSRVKRTFLTARRRPARSRQAGFTLPEMMVAIVVAGILAAAGHTAMTYLDESNTAANLASGINQVYQAAGAYVTTNYTQLINSQAVSGFANPNAPTIQELVAKQFLPPSFSATGYTGGTWRTQIVQQGTCPGAFCNLLWKVWLDKAPLQNGFPSVNLVAAAAQRSGIPAGFSPVNNPATVIGLNASWNMPNPVGAQPAILAAEGSFNSSQFASYLPRSGALPMTGDFNAGGHNITAANNLSANSATVSGNVSANTMSLPGGNSLTIGSAQYYGDATNAAIRVQGALYVQGTNGAGNRSVVAQDGDFSGNANVSGGVNANTVSANWIQSNGDAYTAGNQTINGVLTAHNLVQLPALAWAGWACSGNAVTTDPNGQLLSCQSGVWTAAGGARIHFDQVTYQYVGDGGYCPPNTVAIGAGGWYQTYTAGYLYCAAYY